MTKTFVAPPGAVSVTLDLSALANAQAIEEQAFEAGKGGVTHTVTMPSMETFALFRSDDGGDPGHLPGTSEMILMGLSMADTIVTLAQMILTNPDQGLSQALVFANRDEAQAFADAAGYQL